MTCRALLSGFSLLAFSLSPAQNTQNPRPESSNPRLEHGREFLGLPAPPDPVAVARGQKIFAANCSFCHGQDAKGAEGPNLIRSTMVLHDEKGNLIGAFLPKGRPDRGMPAFPSLTPDQLSDLAAFLHQRVEDTSNRFGYKILNVVTGNSKEGKQYFEAHCTTCHSATGDLAHIGSEVEPADLQARFLYPSERISKSGERNAIPVQVTVTLPTGEQFSGQLKRIDDFDISMNDSSGEFHSWPRSGLKIDIKDPLSGHRDLLSQYSDADMHNVLAYLVTLK